jgi:hypothetical protein
LIGNRYKGTTSVYPSPVVLAENQYSSGIALTCFAVNTGPSDIAHIAAATIYCKRSKIAVFVGAKQVSSALPAFDLRGSKGEAR